MSNQHLTDTTIDNRDPSTALATGANEEGRPTPSQTSEFDQIPDEPYASCTTCSGTFDTKDDSQAHMLSTAKDSGGRSHRVRISNPSRPERIERRVGSLIDDAVVEIIDELINLERRGQITDEEIGAALKGYDLIADAWQDYLYDEH